MFATIIISALVAPVALGGRILPSSSRIERAPEIHESEHELSEFHTPQARLLFQCELLHLMHTVCSLLSLHQSGGLAVCANASLQIATVTVPVAGTWLGCIRCCPPVPARTAVTTSTCKPLSPLPLLSRWLCLWALLCKPSLGTSLSV